MTAGRPSTYDPSYCDRVRHLGAEGYSIVEMCADIGCGRTSLERAWPEANPEFAQAMEDARLASQAWWERQGREGLSKDKFQAALYSRSMAARFPHDWREKTLLGSDPDNPLPAAGITMSGLSEATLREIAAQGVKS